MLDFCGRKIIVINHTKLNVVKVTMSNFALLMNFLGKERDSVEASQAQPTKKQGRKNPMKMLSIIGFCLSLFTVCLSSGAAEAARARVNSRSGLNVRLEPNPNSNRVYGLRNGQIVNTTGRFLNGWAQLSNGYWVSNSYLNYTGGGTGGGRRGRTARVTASKLNVRHTPGHQFGLLGTLSRGQIVRTDGTRSGKWVGITYDGTPGWVWGDYLSFSGGGTGGGTRTSLLRRISSRSGGANIRSGPGTNNRKVNYFSNGTPLTLTGRSQNGWYELTRGRGWIAGNLLGSGSGTIGGTGGGTGGGSRSIRYVSVSSRSGGANVRSGPGMSNSKLDYYSNGTTLGITGNVVNGWYELKGSGWIAGNLLQK